jgi:hypothetical protein
MHMAHHVAGGRHHIAQLRLIAQQVHGGGVEGLGIEVALHLDQGLQAGRDVEARLGHRAQAQAQRAQLGLHLGLQLGTVALEGQLGDAAHRQSGRPAAPAAAASRSRQRGRWVAAWPISVPAQRQVDAALLPLPPQPQAHGLAGLVRSSC